MSLTQLRGGVPDVFRATIDTTGRPHKIGANCFFLKIRVATNPCRMYFREADFTNNENYVLVPVPAADAPYGEWEGPVELPDVKEPRVWLKGDGGNSVVELVAFKRRG